MSNEPISLSEDRLRAILAEFKLDLIERLTRELARKADAAHVDALEKQQDIFERDMKAHLSRIDGWRNRVAGAMGLLTVLVLPIAIIVLAQVVQQL